MKKLIKLPITRMSEGGEDFVFVIYGHEHNRDWCLNLCLLKEGLIESLTVVDDKEPYKLRIAPDSSPSLRRSTGRPHVDGADVSVSYTELDYWIDFFLKYYRDGVGEVDHIDVEVHPHDPTTTTGPGITLQIPDALPPISGEEARRRLGLY